MNLDDAKAIVEHEMNKGYVPTDDGPLVVLDQYTKEKTYGWIFAVNTRRFSETGDFDACAIGIGPIVFVSEDRSIHQLGAGCDEDEEIAEFERHLESRKRGFQA